MGLLPRLKLENGALFPLFLHVVSSSHSYLFDLRKRGPTEKVCAFDPCWYRRHLSTISSTKPLQLFFFLRAPKL